MNNFDEFLLKRYKIIIAVLVILFLTALIIFIQTLSNLNTKSSESKSDNNIQLTTTPVITEEEINNENEKDEKEWNIGNRESNTTEVITVNAKKITEKDIVAIIRLKVVGGEIIDKTSQYIMLEGCNQSNFDKMTNVCVDIAKQTPFIEGETILSISIKWDSSSNHQILINSENGYYNGIEFNASSN